MTRLPVTWALNRPRPRKLVTSALPAITLSTGGSILAKTGAWICDAEPFVSGPAPGVSLAKRRSESTQWFLRIWRFMRGQLVLREQERRRRARYQKVR